MVSRATPVLCWTLILSIVGCGIYFIVQSRVNKDDIPSEESLYSGVKGDLSSAGHRVMDSTGSAYHTVMDGTGNAYHAAIDGTGNAYHTVVDGTGNICHSAMDSTGNAYHTVVDGTCNACHTVIDGTGNTYHKVMGGMGDAFRCVGDYISPPPPTMGEKVVDEFKEVAGHVSN